MNRITLLILLLLTCACKQESDPYTMYGLLNEEINYSIEMLKVQIAENLSNEKLTNSISAMKYDSLTNEYVEYLDNTYNKLLENIDSPVDYNGELSKKNYVNELFFIENKRNDTGIEFISKMEKYRMEILKLINDKNLAKRVSVTLNTMDIQNKAGKTIDYLTFFYHDMPLISVLAHLKNKERSILEFENEFLKNVCEPRND